MANPPLAHRACLLLPGLLRRLADEGLPVAQFVSGNDLERLAYFVHDHGESCCGRRLGEPSQREVNIDLGYLRDHHLDFDHFPLLVRHTNHGRQLHLLVVGGRCVGAASWSHDGRWSGANGSLGAARGHAEAAAQFAELAVTLVHVEQRSATKAVVVGLDPDPDLGALDRDAGLAATDAVAEWLVAAARARSQDVLQVGVTARQSPASVFDTNADGQALARTPQGTPAAPRSPNGTSARLHESARVRVGIVCRMADAEGAAVTRALAERGAEAVPVELPLFPDRRAVHECATGSRIATTELAELDAIYLRSVGTYFPLADLRPSQGDAAEWASRLAGFVRTARDGEACFRFKYGLLEMLGQRIPIINPPLSQEIHRNKVHQLFALMRAGLPVPPTVAGSSRDNCRQFVAAQGGEAEVVAKPLAGIHKTRLLAEVGLDAVLANGPAILQRYVRGEVIRAYLVGDQLVGAGRVLHRGRSVDSSVEQTGVERVALPDHVARMGRAAAGVLGLTWTGMDLVREAKSGDYFILECNASPMFANFSAATGCDVAGPLAQLLVQLARG